MSSSLAFALAPLMGWLVAHVVKFMLVFIKSNGKERDLAVFVRAGGMPSSHTSVMFATLTVIGAREGTDTAVFGLGVAITAIVIYDALNVRRAVGEQGNILARLLLSAKSTEKFFAAQGHTITEVLAGAAVGVVVGYGLLQIL